MERSRDDLGNLLQRLFDKAPDGLVVTRLRDGLIVLANQAMGRLLGYSMSEVVGRSSEEFGLWPGAADRAEITRKLSLGESPASVEWRLVTRDGVALDVEITAEIVDIGGEFHAFAIAREVTERNRAQRDLRESEERFRSLVKNSRDGIMVTDHAGWLTYVSPGAAAILGEEPGALVGRPERELIHPQDLQVRDRVLARLKEDESPHPMVELRMRHRDGTWRWVETMDTNRLEDPSVLGIITNFRDVTQRKTLDEAMAYRALHDPLTGLPNRRLLDDRIETALAAAKRSEKAVAVLFCDLDNFKEVNDRLGHEIGDRLLTRVARRLAEAIRPGDSLARLGGDEFVVVCGDLATELEAGLVAERIVEVLRTPIDVDGEQVLITGSIGIAISASQQPVRVDAGALLRNADVAMYRAKERGRDRWEMFDAAMLEQARARVRLIEDLRGAIQAGQLVALYQPIVALETGRTVGAEALLRWRHPERGLLLPEVFLEAAESSGLIVPIGDWVLGEALNRLGMWHAIVGRELWVSVNVSGRQLGDQGMRQALARRLDGSGLGGFLRLELTESILIENSLGVDSELAAAVAMGVRVGLDDFGTGYSSMTYLQRLPISFLKIDRRFLADLRPGIPAKARDSSRSLLSAIIGLTRTLGIDAIAEGIETADQAAALLELGCPYGQGFHFAMPDGPEKIELTLRREHGITGDSATPRG